MTSTPCAACKLLRRKCTQECVFAPYFPPSQPQKFAFVHRVFGASNVAKILNELPSHHREEAVNSLYYEAEARLRDPIHGCVGLVSFLQQRLKKMQHDLVAAKTELSTYVGVDDDVFPYLPLPPHNFMAPPSSLSNFTMMHLHQQQQELTANDAQRLAAMLLDRGDEGVFDGSTVTVTGYNQMDVNEVCGGGSSSGGPSLALASFEQGRDDFHHDQLQTQLMLQPPEPPQDAADGQFLLQPTAVEEPVQMH